MAPGSSIFIRDIPSCLNELREAISDFDREADEAFGQTPDGEITQDNFAYLKVNHPGSLERFDTLGQFKRYVSDYVDSMKFHPVCQEEAGLAVDEQPINLGSIPRCVSFDGGVSLYSALLALDAKADGGTSDGRFTQKNFRKIKRSERDLARFKSFGKFKKYVRQYIDSQRCTEACRAERMETLDPEGDAICYAPDEPQVPQLPPPRRKRKASDAGSKPEPDLSAFSNDYPKWHDDPVPYEQDPRYAQDAPTTYASIPSFEQLIAARMERDLMQPDLDLPEGLSGDRPEMHVFYDGKDLVLDMYGCFVRSIEDRRCIADWSYHIGILHNIRTGKTRKKHAGVDGKLRVRVPAKVGEIVTFVGRDPGSNRYSINKLYFEIMPDKSIKLVHEKILNSDGSDYAPPKANEVVGLFLESTIPFLGPAAAFLVDPKGAARRYKGRVDAAIKSGLFGETEPEYDCRNPDNNSPFCSGGSGIDMKTLFTF